MCCLSSCRPSGLLTWMVSWVTFACCPVVAGIAGTLSFLRAVKSGSALAMTRSSILSPFILAPLMFATHAGIDYAKGNARIYPEASVCPCSGRADIDASWNVDPVTRLPISHAAFGHKANAFTFNIYNRAVRRLVRMMGPQRGSWTGEMPTPAEATMALLNGRNAQIADFEPAQDLIFYFNTPANFVVTSIYRCPVGPGREWRFGSVRGMSILGRGSDFFVVIDPGTGRVVARYGEPAR